MAIAEPTSAYSHVAELLAAERCVMLDGGMGTELGRHMPATERSARGGAVGHVGPRPRAARRQGACTAATSRPAAT